MMFSRSLLFCSTVVLFFLFPVEVRPFWIRCVQNSKTSQAGLAGHVSHSCLIYLPTDRQSVVQKTRWLARHDRIERATADAQKPRRFGRTDRKQTHKPTISSTKRREESKFT